MKAQYFISNQYGTSNYELVKEMMLLVKKNTQCCGDSKKAINTVPSAAQDIRDERDWLWMILNNLQSSF